MSKLVFLRAGVAAMVLAGSTALGADDISLFPASGGLEAIGNQGRLMIGFGDSDHDVRKSATKLWGEPVETGLMAECGAGPIDFVEHDNGMMLHFQDGEFVGWFLQFDGIARTADGIGIGSAVAEIKAVMGTGLEILDTTLGHEFWYEDFFGLISAPGDKGIVEALWSGTSCIFR